jgi:hypothetical protein
VFGADHGETLDAAMRTLTVGEEKEEEEGEEGDSDQGEEKRRGKREIAEKENNTVHTHTHTLFTHTHTHTRTHTHCSHTQERLAAQQKANTNKLVLLNKEMIFEHDDGTLDTYL